MAERDDFETIANGDQINEGYFNGILASVAPIGSIVAWAKTLTGVPALIDGWVECDGSVLSDADSPLNGQTIPDLNGDNRFLRGETTSGGTGGSETHTHTLTGAGTLTTGGSDLDISTNAVGTLPTYYEVVWIMKIKNV